MDDLANAVRELSGDKPVAPAAPPSVPAPLVTQQIGRVKTQWTGNASVPVDDVAASPRRPRRSKLPIILAAIVLAGGAAGALGYLATRGGGVPSSSGQASGVAQGGPVAPAPSPTLPSRRRFHRPNDSSTAAGTTKASYANGLAVERDAFSPGTWNPCVSSTLSC